MTNKLSPVILAGRTLQMQKPNDTQAALLHRNGVIAQVTGKKVDASPDGKADEETMSRGWQSVGRIIDILVALFPDAEEQEWLGDQLLAGKVTLQDLVACLEQLAEPPAKKTVAKKAARAA
jgi:hypothetical protein